MSKRKQQTTLFTCWKRKPTYTENNDEERPPSVTDQEGKIQQEIDTGSTSQLKNNPVLSPQSKQQENSEHNLKDPVQEDVQIIIKFHTTFFLSISDRISKRFGRRNLNNFNFFLLNSNIL